LSYTKSDKNGKNIKYKGKLLSLKNFINGYPVVNILINNKRKAYKIHQLVMKYFVENPLNYRCINHTNGDKKDNRLSNLEWCSHSHNIIHSYKILNRKKSRNYNEKNAKSKKVIDTITKTIYPSIAEIIRNKKTIYSYTALRAMLNGQNRNKTQFKYL